MISTFFTIILYSIATILTFFLIGFGLTQIIIPKYLKQYSFWLTPWVGTFFLIFLLVIASLAGISVNQISSYIIAASIILDIIVIFRRKVNINFQFKEEIIIGLFIGISIILNTSPLIRRDRFLTTLSFGNNDMIAYVSSADYLKNHTIIEVFNSNVWEPVGNLLQAAYRFGPPIIGSFFINLFHLEGYQFIYLLETIYFALSLPLLYIFLKLIFKPNLLALTILMFIAVFNVNLLYILYHDFFGQILFWGIEMFLLIFFFSYFYDHKNKDSNLTNYDFILGISIAVFYFTYHEPTIFIFFPLMLFIGISFLMKKNISIYIEKLKKIGLIALFCSSISIVYASILDFGQAFRGNPNQPIGWGLFRAQIPYANPYEALGFYSIHSFAPLPLAIAIILSILIVLIIIYGLLKIDKKLLMSCYLLVFLLFFYWLGIYQNNFFAYNRALTYTLPVWLVLFTVGIIVIFTNLKKSIFIKIFIILLIGLEVFSGIKLNKRFIGERLAVDKSYVSLIDLKNKNIKEPIYEEGFINGGSSLWKQTWIGYFLYYYNISPTPTLFLNDQYANKVPDSSLVLLSKDPWIPAPNIIFKNIIWSNDYFRLGRICNSDECLLKSSKDLSQIEIGKNDYEDSLLVNGWNVNEGEMRWASEKESTLRLVTKGTYPTNLTIDVLSLDKPQEITAYIDDRLIGKIPIETKLKKYSLPINYFLSPGIHKIRFVYSHGYKPMDIVPGNVDSRILYVNFKRIALE